MNEKPKKLKKINPELEPGDRVVLVYMDDYINPVPIGSKGVVHEDSETYRLNRPKFSPKDSGYAYHVTWYDDKGKFISKLPLDPDVDSWIYDKEYYENEYNS
jgi:hypothetical protein